MAHQPMLLPDPSERPFLPEGSFAPARGPASLGPACKGENCSAVTMRRTILVSTPLPAVTLRSAPFWPFPSWTSRNYWVCWKSLRRAQRPSTTLTFMRYKPYPGESSKIFGVRTIWDPQLTWHHRLRRNLKNKDPIRNQSRLLPLYLRSRNHREDSQTRCRS